MLCWFWLGGKYCNCGLACSSDASPTKHEIEVQETSVEKRELSSLVKAISVPQLSSQLAQGCSRALQASECGLLTGQAALGRKLNIVIDFNCSLHLQLLIHSRLCLRRVCSLERTSTVSGPLRQPRWSAFWKIKVGQMISVNSRAKPSVLSDNFEWIVLTGSHRWTQ